MVSLGFVSALLSCLGGVAASRLAGRDKAELHVAAFSSALLTTVAGMVAAPLAATVCARLAEVDIAQLSTQIAAIQDSTYPEADHDLPDADVDIPVRNNYRRHAFVGLNVFQTSVFLLYISIGKVQGGTAPILDDRFDTYTNPLPSVLILTAIVVGVATTSVGLALVVRIKEEYGTIEENEIQLQDEEP